MDPNSFRQFMASAPAGITLPNIGDSFEGGYYGGLISHTADGNATHALIVAPLATGAGGRIYPGAQLLLANTQVNYGASSSYDGALNCSLIGTSNSPILNFILNLSIGGYTDWYLPSWYELSILYNELKPSTQGNHTSFGTNANAVPPLTSNRTSTVPGMTPATDFQYYNNGTEAFYPDADRFGRYHWTSTIWGTDAVYLEMSNGFRSAIRMNYSTRLFAYRAIRRITL